jgi:hypothetical protein
MWSFFITKKLLILAKVLLKIHNGDHILKVKFDKMTLHLCSGHQGEEAELRTFTFDNFLAYFRPKQKT